MYLHETGEYLDWNTEVSCAGSRCIDGKALGTYYNEDSSFLVEMESFDEQHKILRSREVII